MVEVVAVTVVHARTLSFKIPTNAGAHLRRWLTREPRGIEARGQAAVVVACLAPARAIGRAGATVAQDLVAVTPVHLVADASEPVARTSAVRGEVGARPDTFPMITGRIHVAATYIFTCASPPFNQRVSTGLRDSSGGDGETRGATEKNGRPAQLLPNCGRGGGRALPSRSPVWRR